MPNSMYIRVKRKKMIIFLLVDPHESVISVKEKLQNVLDDQPGPGEQRLHRIKTTAGSKQWSSIQLDDDKTLEQQGVEDQEVVALCLKDESGEFEPIQLDDYELQGAGQTQVPDDRAG